MTDTDNQDLADMLDGVMSSYRATSPVVTGPIEIDRVFWSTLDELGLTRLTASTEQGGSDATWAEAALLLSTAGRHAVSLPVVENDLLAHWLLGLAGIGAADDLIRTACVLDSSGTARNVPWANEVDRIVVAWQVEAGWLVEDVDRGAFEIDLDRNIAGEPRGDVRVNLDNLMGTSASVETDLGLTLLLRGALANALLMVGAMERVLDLVVAHTTARTQFGRTLAKFQAVQFMAADIATEGLLARAAADAAVVAAVEHGFDSDQAAFAIAAAKSCAGHAATLVARNAHQAFGAIGFTSEHELHMYTNRILAWRSECESVRHWDNVLTHAIAKAGSVGVWPLIVD
ncbi:acyl-CoA dehydrogenase family protein [Rhodococcus sp. H29-C3]|uniref:acyl-CoA dehydrogenase family protein n=1 Tax=Rhodococcus sp. H29-C3 TaxID=3046307 RepID=UPI0024B989CE|nr:acyl-CoA dehydrogenase family protein [Rhodococcus sp. H29-C3]MDJ0359774.1 acyl-CoA dehydrogenase family protein [Rhodococcus sp. H29-C3]